MDSPCHCSTDLDAALRELILLRDFRRFSLSKNSNSDCNSNKEDGESSVDYIPRSFYKNGIRFYNEASCQPSTFERRRMRRLKPYDISLKKPLGIKPTVNDIPAATAADKDSPLTVSKQDRGDKSNRNGPVKSQSYPVSSGSSIVCLDGLEISKLDFEEDSDRHDMDTVSQRINKLHVN
ncbi:uncharacterized protein TNIN_141141 [Trichonephila inaurata madagascariensis]|uniref:Uncharacterized protein n=1 Tax=Trichonephila inaurata madagascariensis TaxID=2747483 RepID=A0A8X6XFV1_9ARAC|nr:uncharacterized protein TNIN_141141 [Trichonephila inaurata madagascariensis]